MARTCVVTGAASGIGAATVARLRSTGARVIACDLRDAEVMADLTTDEGRAALAEGVATASGGRVDAIVANAGGGLAETSLQLNVFGAVATLERLRPLLAGSPAPRAVAVSSIASLRPPPPNLVELCLAGDEAAAVAGGWRAYRAGELGGTAEDVSLALYGAAKRALQLWCRQAAPTPEWAGAGIPLNVVALGFYDTPAAASAHTRRPATPRGDGTGVPAGRRLSRPAGGGRRPPGLVRGPRQLADDRPGPLRRRRSARVPGARRSGGMSHDLTSRRAGWRAPWGKARTWAREKGPGALVELAVNLGLPLLIYRLTHARLGDVGAMMAASAPPIGWSILQFVRRRKVDALSLLVLAGIALSLFGFLGGGGPRFLQLREHLVAAAIGLIFLGSAAIGKPLIYQLARARA